MFSTFIFDLFFVLFLQVTINIQDVSIEGFAALAMEVDHTANITSRLQDPAAAAPTNHEQDDGRLPWLLMLRSHLYVKLSQRNVFKIEWNMATLWLF